MRLRRKGRERKVPLAVKNDNMSLTQHLAELRMRLIRCLLAVILLGVLVFVLYDPWIQDFLFQPYKDVCAANPDFGCNGEPVLITPLGGFNTRMKVAGWGGFILALPVVLWQVWRFIVPGLEPKEKRYARPFILATVLLFLLGASLAYLTLPKALEWLISFAGQATAAFTPGQLREPRRPDDGGLRRGLPVARAARVPAAGGRRRLQAALALAGGYAIVIIVVVAAVITPSGDPDQHDRPGHPASTSSTRSPILIGWLVSRRRARRPARRSAPPEPMHRLTATARHTGGVRGDRAALLARYDFPLDPFQLQAIDALDAGQSVLVAAPDRLRQDGGGRVRGGRGARPRASGPSTRRPSRRCRTRSSTTCGPSTAPSGSAS